MAPILGVIVSQMAEIITSLCGSILSYVTIERIIKEGYNIGGPTQNSTNIGGSTGNAGSGGTTQTGESSNFSLFYRMVAAFVEGIVRLIFGMNFALMNNNSVIFSLAGKYLGGQYVSILLDHIRKGTIVKNDNGSISVSDMVISEIAKLIIGSFIQKGVLSVDKNCEILGIPTHVSEFLLMNRDVLSVNSIEIGKGDYEQHTIYSKTNQKDIYNNQLIYGKTTIIKFKDQTSDVFTYGLAVVGKASLDEHITNSEGVMSSMQTIISSLSKTMVIGDNNDIEVYEIPFGALYKYIEIIFKHMRI